MILPVLCNGGGDPGWAPPWTLPLTTPATTKCVSIRARLACLPVHLIHRHRTKYDILWGLWIDWYCYFLQTHCKYHSLFTELISLVLDLFYPVDVDEHAWVFYLVSVLVWLRNTYGISRQNYSLELLNIQNWGNVNLLNWQAISYCLDIPWVSLILLSLAASKFMKITNWSQSSYLQ